MTKEILQSLDNLGAGGVTGAKELLTSIENASGQQFENLMTEAFATHFLSTKLKLKVTQIEGSQKILSPHREKDKSCDIKCEDHNGTELYFEVKDSSRDAIRSGIAGIRGYTPSSGSEIRKWISNKVFEAIKKRSNYLIVRIPVWHAADEDPSLSDIDFEISLTNKPQTEIPVCISIDIPSFFRGIYVIKPFGHKFYKPRNVQQGDGGQLRSLRSLRATSPRSIRNHHSA